MAGQIKCAFVYILCFSVLANVFGFNLDITIPVIKKGTNNSYFGFSVAQHQILALPSNTFDPDATSRNVVESVLLVGAPRLNLFPNIKEKFTGGVYSCDASSSLQDDCEQLLQTEYIHRDTNLPEDKGRNDQWLGVTVRSGGVGRGIVVCAHRYKKTDNNYGIGSCYQLTQDMHYNEVMGEGQNWSPCDGLPVVNEQNEYAFCQAGTSAYITKDYYMLAGAPGAVDWTGLVAGTNISTVLGTNKKISFSPTAKNTNPPVPLISYLGYSVVGGTFDNTGLYYIVAGAPRSRDVGQIVFFTLSNQLQYQENQIISGEIPFSGFGNEIIAVDINGDGLDELIVGSPFYYNDTSKNVGGAIFVYTWKGTTVNKFATPQRILSRSMSQEECKIFNCMHARFGHSLTSAGDLNRDGFNDIAVGAPYEGAGAVYIFHGSLKGLKEPFSQRISAKDIPGGPWTTFGYSLSGGLDMDNNSYPDLLVGAYEVDKVALLRTRPIINLISNITVSPNSINMTDTKVCLADGVRDKFCVEIKVCLRFTAEPVERFNGQPVILYKLEAEPQRINPRVEFKNPTDSLGHINDSIKLPPQNSRTRGEPTQACFTQIAYLKDAFTDVLNSLEFKIMYSLPEPASAPPTPSQGALPDINNYPILDAGVTREKAFFTAEVKFAKKCGENEICESDLRLEVDPKLDTDSAGNDILEVGGSLEIRVKVENHGEIAYQTEFYLEKPAELKWQSSTPRDIGCSPFNSTIIECKDIGSKELGNPLKANTEVSFTLSFGTDDISSNIRNFTLKSWVNTTSQDKTPARNVVYNRIRVIIRADIAVQGVSKPDGVIQYKGVIRGESAIKNEVMIGPAINHSYVVENKGPGTIPPSRLTIYWPYELKNKNYARGKHVLYLMQEPQELNNLIKCIFDSDIVNTLRIKVDPDFILRLPPKRNEQVSYTIAGNDSKSDSVGRKRRQSEADSSVQSDSGTSNEEAPKVGEAREKNSVKIDCTSNGLAKCHQIHCDIGQLKKGQYTQVTLRARLWDSTFLEDFKDVSKVYIESYAKIFLDKSLNIEQSTANDKGYAITEAIPGIKAAEKREVAWWIIVVAVLGGLVLLIVLVVLLWKLGFFKRTRPEDQLTYSAKVEKKKDYAEESESFIS
ncbi:hypothetical protein CHS0354_022534 [Potamilus streckersoni]|uniref:Integrin alpha-2 domain-containing protein n=1 Tax=Potamilus streckersoni TaxID=2493646 RepID=A0AAE0SEJ7_9BIVA|nr:hypothetical protein CHS0354_022534 [Potamilus streckersoni]